MKSWCQAKLFRKQSDGLSALTRYKKIGNGRKEKMEAAHFATGISVK